MTEAKQYEPFICFAVRVKGAAAEMIEEVGFLGGVRHSNAAHTHRPYQMENIREAIARAQAAIASYDACMADGVEEITGEEFEAIAKAKVA